MPSALWLLTWTEHGAGQRTLAGRPYREDADRDFETISWQHRAQLAAT